jgi:hypothetical protein
MTSSTDPNTGAAVGTAAGKATVIGVGPPKTFDLHNCRDVLGKLERELDRFKRATLRQDQSDHAANFTLTAWHLAEWVWHSPLSPTLKAKVAAECGLTVKQFDIGAFRPWLGAKCRALQYCYIVCTASKHTKIDRRDDPQVTTLISLSDVVYVTPPRSPDDVTVEWIDVDWTHKMVDGDKRIPLAEAFEEVLRFWTEFIYINRVE